MPASASASSSAQAEPGGAVSPQPRERGLDVAVVVVSYRSAQLVVACLRSLLAERAHAELSITAVVVDNASGDLGEISRAVAHEQWSSWVTLVAAPHNGGFAYGCNLGIERACIAQMPSYVFLLNPDTLVRPGAIGHLVRFLEANRDVGMAGPSFETGDGHDWKVAFRFPTLLGEVEQGLQLAATTRLLQRWAVVRYMGEQPERVDWISGASMMIRPEVFAAIGGLDENYFLFFEETDLCRRARRAGFATWYVPESRVMHIGGSSTSVSSSTRSRLPACWFESRRRYFLVTYGVLYAMAIDLAAVSAHLLGALKRTIQGRAGVRWFVRDLLHHSVLWPRNRNVAPLRTRVPASAPGAQLASSGSSR